MMNKMKQRFFALALLTAVAGAQAHSTAAPYFSIRSQGANTVREMVGWEEFINLCEMDAYYGALAVVPEYSQSFRSRRICECLFGDDVITSSNSNNCDPCDDCQINISGSCVENRGDKDWLADYFGLPTDFQSSINLSPRIRNFVADVQFFLGLAEWSEGLYARIHLPITHTRWDLRFCENVINAGSDLEALSDNAYNAGYFTDALIERSNLLNNAIEFLSGEKVPTLGDGFTFQNLCCSRWAACGCDGDTLTKTRLADVEFVFGWNFVCDEDYHFGLNIRFEAPTGNSPKGDFIFEPIVGNGDHWTLGGGLSTHAVLWRGDESDSTFSIYLDANIVHLFDKCQKRCFDLCGKPNSRYMLAMKMRTLDNAGDDSLSGDTTTDLPSHVFANEYAPVANITQSNVDVSSSVQGDVTVKFAYASDGGFQWDFGYNFWGRSCEKLCRKGSCKTDGIDTGLWALKGDAFVYGFQAESESEPSTQALSATQKSATIHGGLNLVGVDCTSEESLTAAARNPNIDNSQGANTENGGVNWQDFTLGGQVNTSVQPELLSASDLDLVRTRGISHKVFTHLGYAWLENEWTPFLGVGASVEFSPDRSCDDDCDTSCDPCDPCGTKKGNCVRCALNQWSVWVKSGFAFN